MTQNKQETIQDKAKEARKYFKHRTRSSTGESFWTCTDNRPEWVHDMVYTAHAKELPDDYKYQFVVEALDAICDADDLDDITIEPDLYNSDLTAWLSSSIARFSYCDDAIAEYGPVKSLFDLLQLGQQREREEVLYLVIDALEELAD